MCELLHRSIYHAYVYACGVSYSHSTRKHIDSETCLCCAWTMEYPDEQWRCERANHNSSFSFYPFNRIPSHQNVCAQKIKARVAADASGAYIVDIVVVVFRGNGGGGGGGGGDRGIVILQFGFGWHKMHFATSRMFANPVCVCVCAMHILRRCMAINSFGRFHSFMCCHPYPFLQRLSANALFLIRLQCFPSIVVHRAMIIMLHHISVCSVLVECKMQQQHILFIWETARRWNCHCK